MMLWKHQLLGFSIQFPVFLHIKRSFRPFIHLRSLQASPTLLVCFEDERGVCWVGTPLSVIQARKTQRDPRRSCRRPRVSWLWASAACALSGPRPQMVRTFDRLPESIAHSSFLSHFFHSLLQNMSLKTFPASISGKVGQMLFL